MITLRPTRTVSLRPNGSKRIEHTLRSKSDADCVGEDIDALENGGATLVRELDFLVRAARERGCRARRLGGSTAESAGGRGRDGVHYDGQYWREERRRTRRMEGKEDKLRTNRTAQSSRNFGSRRLLVTHHGHLPCHMAIRHDSSLFPSVLGQIGLPLSGLHPRLACIYALDS